MSGFDNYNKKARFNDLKRAPVNTGKYDNLEREIEAQSHNQCFTVVGFVVNSKKSGV